MKIRLIICLLIISIFFLAGCKPEIYAPKTTLKISEPIGYSFSINNPDTFPHRDFSNLSIKLTYPTDKLIINATEINLSSLENDKTSELNLIITSLSIGDFKIQGTLNYVYDNTIQSPIFFNIDTHAPLLGDENYLNIKLKEDKLIIEPTTDFGISKNLHINIEKEKDDLYKYGKIKINSELYSTLNCVEGYRCDKEGGNILWIYTDISKNREIPFTLAINKPGSITNSVSFTATMELWYSKDGSSNWIKIVENSFPVNSR